MMQLNELQTKILTNTHQLHKLARMITSMPECDARNSLQVSHDKILLVLARLADAKDNIAPGSCDYGFTDKCPGCICSDCQFNEL